MAVVPGSVLHLFFNDIGNPKHKFGVLVSNDPVRFFLINTRIGSFVHHTAEVRRSQVEIRVDSHAFLDHDSWLDCTECYDGGFTARSLEAHVKTARRCIVGTISNDVRAAIVGVVEASRLLSPAEKAEILAALS